MNKTDIEYLTHTWNPIAMRCTKKGDGCANCWHLRMCDRLATNPKLSPEIRAAYAGEGPPVLVEERLRQPLGRKKPAMVGTQFMGDLFYGGLPLMFIKRVWNMMAACQQHTFLILTKRAKRMNRLVNSFVHLGWPVLPNVIPGVSIEDQETADERIPFLLATPAARRVVSVEPLLGKVELKRSWLYYNLTTPGLNNWAGLNWIIAGCESGPGRRPAERKWFVSLRDQCVEAGIPFCLKQMEIDGKVVKMPELEGQVWDIFPR
jgi:protein gp37